MPLIIYPCVDPVAVNPDAFVWKGAAVHLRFHSEVGEYTSWLNLTHTPLVLCYRLALFCKKNCKLYIIYEWGMVSLSKMICLIVCFIYIGGSRLLLLPVSPNSL